MKIDWPELPDRSPYPALDRLHHVAEERNFDVGLLPCSIGRRAGWVLRLTSHGTVAKSETFVDLCGGVDLAAFSLLQWLTNPPQKEAIR